MKLNIDTPCTCPTKFGKNHMLSAHNHYTCPEELDSDTEVIWKCNCKWHGNEYWRE